MRILMLGNSLTTANGLPAMLGSLLEADVQVHARGGARLAEHLNPATKLGAKTAAALADEQWDYVVLQEMSNGPMRYPERFRSVTEELCSRARACGAQPILYATWAYAPDCPKLEKLGVSHDEMHAALHEAFALAAEGAQARIADAGTAFFEHVDKVGLYAPDGVHPSVAGTQLAAECLAGAVRGEGAASSVASRGDARYYVYLLRCEDGTYYTGITTDVERRFKEHKERGPKAARYTRTHPVEELAASWEMPDRSAASKVEVRIKRLKHDEKALLANAPEMLESLVGVLTGRGSHPSRGE